MESKKILMVMALITILLPSSLARVSVVDFETDSAIADEFNEAEDEIPLSEIILEGLDNNQVCGGRCRFVGRPCPFGGPRCFCTRVGMGRRLRCRRRRSSDAF